MKNLAPIGIKKAIILFLVIFSNLSVSCTHAQNNSKEEKGQNNKIAICAHRGYWLANEVNKAQNSIASLKAAQAINVWGSEFDIHLTSDDIIIVNHDQTLGGLDIWENPWSSFKTMKLSNGETPATLSEYLAAGKEKNTILVCELKPQKNSEKEILLADMAIKEIKKHELYDPKKIIFISFSYNICKHIAANAPNFMVQYLSGNKTPDELYTDGIMGLDYHYLILLNNPDWIKRAHELGMSVNAWTVNKKEDIERVIGLGVDCITTDYPLIVRELLSGKEITP